MLKFLLGFILGLIVMLIVGMFFVWKMTKEELIELYDWKDELEQTDEKREEEKDLD